MKELEIGVIIALEPSVSDALTLVNKLGLSTIQIIYAHGLDNTIKIGEIRTMTAKFDIEISSIACVFPNGGLATETGRGESIRFTQMAAAFARKLRIQRLQGHVGYIPEDPSDANYMDTVKAMQCICDALADAEIEFAVETGKETAICLLRFIRDVDRPNLKVNFDPANMVLYGTGDPFDALDLLYPYVDGVHCKDGRAPMSPGTLGLEVALGQGDVRFHDWLVRLIHLGYRGPLTIEREIAGDERIRDIEDAISLIRAIRHHKI